MGGGEQPPKKSISELAWRAWCSWEVVRQREGLTYTSEHLSVPECHWHVCVLLARSCLTLCDPWTVACKVPLSMGFSRQEYWSGFPCPPPDDLSNPGMEPVSLGSFASQADSLPTAPPEESMLLLLLLQMIKRPPVVEGKGIPK